MASFNVNDYADRRHSGCPHMTEDKLEVGTDSKTKEAKHEKTTLSKLEMGYRRRAIDRPGAGV
jgi:hypothetical protein